MYSNSVAANRIREPSLWKSPKAITVKAISHAMPIVTHAALLLTAPQATGRVRFTGWQEDTDPCFARCDVAVFPSRWQEPFGLSGAEALGHGVPVVAFDTGGVRERLESSKIPACMKGFPITLVSAGLMAVAFMGFNGLV